MPNHTTKIVLKPNLTTDTVVGVMAIAVVVTTAVVVFLCYRMFTLKHHAPHAPPGHQFPPNCLQPPELPDVAQPLLRQVKLGKILEIFGNLEIFHENFFLEIFLGKFLLRGKFRDNLCYFVFIARFKLSSHYISY